MLIYSFHVYQWPSVLLSDLAKCMRNFIWSGDTTQRKICTVAWKVVCKPRDEGGLGVKDPSLVNRASLLHLSWKLLTSNDHWAILCRARFLHHGKPKANYFTSSVWYGLKRYIQKIYDHSTWSVGNGKNIFFWIDKWLDRAIFEHWNIPPSLHDSLDMKVSECIMEGSWCLPDFLVTRDPDLANSIIKITLPVEDVLDRLNWHHAIDGVMTSKLAYTFLAGTGNKIPWHKLVWNVYTPPTRSFITWRWIHDKLPIDDNLRKRGCFVASLCCFCKQRAESSNHIFLSC